MDERWEIGSEFDWREEFVTLDGPCHEWPSPRSLFSSGRAALLSLLRQWSDAKARRTLHLPSFFCMEVAATLATVTDLAWYRDVPDQEAPDLDTLRAEPGDLVLAVNLFGRRDGSLWNEWRSRNPEILVIEDHTHDPFSPWAQESAAPYVWTSLRKTLPIPDGALLWSPQGLPLPSPASSPSHGSNDKLIGMLLKGLYLKGACISKEEYRTLQMSGEDSLAKETDSPVSPFTHAILNGLDIPRMRRRREANVREFNRALLELPQDRCAPLFTSWPEGGVPFNALLVCKDEETRDELRRYLIGEKIYTAIHWKQKGEPLHSQDPEALSLSQRILTVPVDQRYSCEDIHRLVEIMGRGLVRSVGQGAMQR
ncbi:MAG: DegT/DnrJ/EryC1/StrS aminotransferase family protein [Armatimonadetes bacterium]|nr:DegT/DnrJ/EryC1/StrS aminotransferase family protein [Armatimonadota bacterium]